MGTCQHCGKESRTISRTIGFCADCIRTHFREVWQKIKPVHDQSREDFGLPKDPPRARNGVPCSLCFQKCRIPEGGKGYCGLRTVKNGRLTGGRPHEGDLSYYYDPFPTNCVGHFVCPGGTECGYPQYTYSRGPEYGYKNMAVFYHACSFNCLYCQNYHFKKMSSSSSKIAARDLANAVDDSTSCICYFGGDPSPQILHALKTSKLALNRAVNRVLRVCWETNGTVREPFLSQMADLSMRSGGCIKVDLKAWDEGIHYVLCGVTNRNTLENFQKLAGLTKMRPDPPLLIASTLLVPGYIDEQEVERIAGLIAGLNPVIPYSLLAFYPHFYLSDLPTTSRAHALGCKSVAEKAGLHHVHVGIYICWGMITELCRAARYNGQRTNNSGLSLSKKRNSLNPLLLF